MAVSCLRAAKHDWRTWFPQAHLLSSFLPPSCSPTLFPLSPHLTRVRAHTHIHARTHARTHACSVPLLLPSVRNRADSGLTSQPEQALCEPEVRGGRSGGWDGLAPARSPQGSACGKGSTGGLDSALLAGAARSGRSGAFPRRLRSSAAEAALVKGRRLCWALSSSMHDPAAKETR